MSEAIHKSHNISRLMYYFVLPAKYRRAVVREEVEEVIKETCRENFQICLRNLYQCIIYLTKEHNW